jgi:hypothetical protein
MKKLITNYTFNPTAKTITFNDYSSINLERILLITNVTRNVIIYNFADPNKGGSVSNNVLTLNYDTTGMASTDKLQIFYDEGFPAVAGLSGAATDITFTLTNADTAYAIPQNPPANYYTLIIYNSSDVDVYFRFTEGTTAGIKIPPGSYLSIDLGSNQQVYVYCRTAGKTINISYKII